MTYLPNPLNSYSTYSYNIALYMIDPTITNSPSTISNKILMADNSRISNYNIQTLEQTNTIGTDVIRETFANRFDITITEQNGATFFNKILEVSQQMGIPNHLKAMYLLEITFPARDMNNRPVRYPLKFAYSVTFIDVSATIDQNGTQYNITAYDTPTTAYSYLHNVSPSTIEFSGETVGDVVAAFNKSLNDSEYTNWLEDTGSQYPNSYEITFDDDTQDWANWPIANTNENINTNKQQTDGNKTIFHYQAGTNITEFLGIILNSTTEYRSIQAVGGGVIRDNPSDEATCSAAKIPYLFKIIGNVTNDKFDVLRNDYSKKISFKIKKYKATGLVVDPSYSTNTIGNTSAQKQKISSLYRNDLLRKRYDYLFTGLNTEVIGLDLKLNMTYYVMTPIAGGQIMQDVLNSNNGNNTQSIVDKVRSLKTKIKTNNDKLTALLKTRGTDSGILSTTMDNAATLADEFNKLSGITAADITNSKSINAQFSKDRIDDKFSFAGPAVDNTGQSQLRMGAVNANSETSGDLLEIEINIKGDPYWLGKPNSFYGNNDDDLADYESGGCNFFLRVNLPVTEDSNGRRKPTPDYMCTGVYRVISVINQYRNGLFTQYLKAYRDVTIQSELVLPMLEKGEVSTEDRR